MSKFKTVLKTSLLSVLCAGSATVWAASLCNGMLKSDPSSLEALQKAAQKNDKTQIKRLLLHNCVDVSKAILSANTPAFFFATDAETLSWYIQRGVNLKTKSKDGLTSVMYALAQRTASGAKSKNIDDRVNMAMKTVLTTNDKSFLKEKDKLGRTALHFSIMFDRVDATKTLLAKEPSLLTEGTAQGLTPWFAVFQTTCNKKTVSDSVVEALRKASTKKYLESMVPSPIAPWLKISTVEFAVLRQNESPVAAKAIKTVVGNAAWDEASKEINRLKKERPDLAKKLRYFEYTSIPKFCDAVVEE